MALATIATLATLTMTGSTPIEPPQPSKPLPFGDIRRDAVIGSVSASESLGFFSEGGLMGPSVIEVNKLMTPDGRKETFITSTANTRAGCPANVPASCVDGNPYPHFMTPNASISMVTGNIYGDAVRQDPKNFAGPAYNINIGVGPISISAFSSVNKLDGKANYKTVGLELSFGKSLAPGSLAMYYTNTELQIAK